jgi:hypothetical protein
VGGAHYVGPEAVDPYCRFCAPLVTLSWIRWLRLARVLPGTLAISLLNHSPDRYRLLAVAIERETFDRRQGEGAGLRVNLVIECLLSRHVCP